MTIILFLVDTSASMSQRACRNANGAQNSLLDMAKYAVETFLRYRQHRSNEWCQDRYMLLTYDEPPAHIKSGWKDNMTTFASALRNLQCSGLTTTTYALHNAYDTINLFRLNSGIETYGHGRCPYYCESTTIVIITDGGREQMEFGISGARKQLLHDVKLTKELFRWDQRVYALVLRPPGQQREHPEENECYDAEGRLLLFHDNGAIEKLCTDTGGRSYKVCSQKMLNICIDNIVKKLRAGVIVSFRLGPAQSVVAKPQPTKVMIYLSKSSTEPHPTGYWPLPEAYCWLEPNAEKLPPRDAYPKFEIKSSPMEEPEHLLKYLPCDKYELEPCALTEQLLGHRSAYKCWLVCVSHEHGHKSIGYLKRSSHQVHFHVLPYNYPALLPLLQDLAKYEQWRKTSYVKRFKCKLKVYLESTPLYYRPFLRNTLKMRDEPGELLKSVFSEMQDFELPSSIAKHLSSVKHIAKELYEKQNAFVNNQLKLQSCPPKQLPLTLTADLTSQKWFLSNPHLRDTFGSILGEFNANLLSKPIFVLPQTERQGPTATDSYRNPFGIARRHLVDDIARMRAALLQPNDNIHKHMASNVGNCVPIGQMGNYQTCVRRNQRLTLREVMPTDKPQNLFGNPYKKSQRMLMIDETDSTEDSDDLVSTGHVSPRRHKGPLRSDFIFKRQQQQAPAPAGDLSLAGSCTRINTDSVSPARAETVPQPKEMAKDTHKSLSVNTHIDAKSSAPAASSHSHLPNIKYKSEISFILEEWCSKNSEQSKENNPNLGTTSTTHDQRRKAIDRHNLSLRMQIFRDIRRPGRDYSQLLAHLDLLQGDRATQADCVRLCIMESQKFRRKHMILNIREWWARREIQLKVKAYD